MKEPTDQEIMEYWQLPVEDTISTVRHFLALAKQEPEGVLSFNDMWYEECNNPLPALTSYTLAQRIWNDARQGMIPAANAIQIPPESEWSKDATDIQLLYTNPSTVFMRIPIAIIPRSKPAWKPKVGDKIAYWFDGMTAVYFGEYGNLDEVFRNEPHYAKVEQLSDIGHDIAWFKANRSWI